MEAAAEFATLSPETRAAIMRYERETGRRIADEIAERDEQMVKLFLILRGYYPRLPARDDPKHWPTPARR